MSFASPLDETLDREVFLMLQGPTPEYMAQEFKGLLNKLVTTWLSMCVSLRLVGFCWSLWLHLKHSCLVRTIVFQFLVLFSALSLLLSSVSEKGVHWGNQLYLVYAPSFVGRPCAVNGQLRRQYPGQIHSHVFWDILGLFMCQPNLQHDSSRGRLVDFRPTCFVFTWFIKLYNVISIFLSLHLLLSFPSLSAYLLFLFCPPTISPLLRSLPYITLQQAPSKQRCLVSVLYHDHNPLPSSLTPTFCVSLCSYPPSLLFLMHCCHSAFIRYGMFTAVLPYSSKHTKWDRNH